MGFVARLHFDKDAVKLRIQTGCDRGITVISSEALEDANEYAREDSGDLIASSYIASQPEKGLLVWNTPYAKRMYYTGTPVLDVNKRASLMWAHKGAAENRGKYQRTLDKLKKEGY